MNLSDLQINSIHIANQHIGATIKENGHLMNYYMLDVLIIN